MRNLIKCLAKYIFILCMATSGWTRVIVDVYGVDEKTANHVLEKYASLVRLVEKDKMDDFIQMNYGKNNAKRTLEILNKKEKLIKYIQKKENFIFVDLQTIHYPDEKDIYTTIEIIRADEPSRLKFIPKETTKIYPEQKDIIKKMQDFQQISMNLLVTNKTNPKNEFCPVFHCLAPFSHPILKPYLTEFNDAAAHDKKKIISTLNTDENPERRAAAAFLIGHFTNPQEIIKTLIPHINDNSNSVRNNVMRVLGATIYKANIANVDVVPFINQLDSPYVTDRNKALYVLFAIANSPSGKKQILNHGKEKLVQILRLKQPNNHDIAYFILKMISNKEYASTDIKGWEKWSKETSSAKKHSII